MKKLRLIALLMGIVTLGFAQPKFTEQTLDEFHQAFVANPAKAVAERAAPDFMMIGNEGGTRDYASFKALNESGGLTAWPVSEVKIKQFGNVAIVKGITDHAAKFPNGVVKFHQRFTETYEFQNGKWMFASAHYSEIVPKKADEEAAIKKLLVDERKAFYAGSKDGMISFWKNDPHTFVNASYPNGNQFYMNNEVVQKSMANFKPNDNAVGTITSSQVKIYGTNAIADLELTATHKNGSVHKEHNIVLLEKEAEAWKILGYSVHGLPKDKQEDSAAIVKVIEKETQAFHDRDADGRIACIANVPYAVMLVHHGVMASNNGVAYMTNEKTNAPEAIKAQMAGIGKSTGSTFKNENYVVTIKGGTAFVNYTEITTAADGTKQYGHAVRNLERIDGLWKLTYIGGVFYKP